MLFYSFLQQPHWFHASQEQDLPHAELEKCFLKPGSDLFYLQIQSQVCLFFPLYTDACYDIGPILGEEPVWISYRRL